MRSFRTIVLRDLHGGFADAERTACLPVRRSESVFPCRAVFRVGPTRNRVSTCILRACRRPYGCPGKYAPADRINPPGRSFPICRLGVMRETASLKGQHKLKSFRISAGTVRTVRLPGRFLRPCRNPRRPVRGIWAPVGSLRIWLPAPCRLPHCGQAKCLSSFRSSESRSVPLPA